MTRIRKTLDETDPELAKEWHPTKNGNLLPSDFTRASKEKVWWQCLNNQEHPPFNSIIDNRVYRKTICPLCAYHNLSLAQRGSLEEFLLKAKSIHFDKFNYDKVIYINRKTKVIIICNTCCNEFLQEPHSHLDGRGCPKCANIEHSKRLYNSHITENGEYNSYSTYNRDTFLENAGRVHGDAYDYSKVIYVRSIDKVLIFCKKCTSYFEQTPTDHINSEAGCPKCGREKLSLIFRDTIEEVIGKANEVHNFKYDYSELEYVNNNTIGKIFCKNCQTFFKQRINSHLNGSGCPNCRFFLNERITGEWLRDALKISIDNQYKIVKDDLSSIRVDYRFILNGQEYIVEYNGRQHYQPVRFGSESIEKTIQTFEKQKLRDQWLKEYCIKNNIILIAIDGREYKGKKIKKFLSDVFRRTYGYTIL